MTFCLLWNIQEDHLRNINNQNSFVTNILQNNFFYVPQMNGVNHLLKRCELRNVRINMGLVRAFSVSLIKNMMLTRSDIELAMLNENGKAMGG